MAVIIEQAHSVCVEKRVRLFELRRDQNCDFQFNVVEGKPVFQCEAARKNFQYCLEHPEEYEDKGVVVQKEASWQDARAICECGKEIFLSGTYMGLVSVNIADDGTIYLVRNCCRQSFGILLVAGIKQGMQHEIENVCEMMKAHKVIVKVMEVVRCRKFIRS